jgi:hypothetical protein
MFLVAIVRLINDAHDKRAKKIELKGVPHNQINMNHIVLYEIRIYNVRIFLSTWTGCPLLRLDHGYPRCPAPGVRRRGEVGGARRGREAGNDARRERERERETLESSRMFSCPLESLYMSLYLGYCRVAGICLFFLVRRSRFEEVLLLPV